MPTISVIIPVYNVEQYLDRCVKSVLAQTYTDYEIILVDDGSPDNSPQMCDAYAEKHDCIRVIHKENGGLSSARNAGLEIAQGKYVTFLDSDDFFHPEALSIMVERSEEASADICVCEYKVVDGALDDYPDIDKGNIEISNYTGIEAVRQIFVWRKSWEFVSSCVKIYRKEIFNDIKFPIGKLHEDNFTTWKCYLASKQVIKCYVPLYYIFRNPNGITRSPYSLRRLDALEASEEMMETLKNVDEELFRFAVDDFFIACQYACGKVRGELKNEEVYRKLKKKLIYVKKNYGLKKPFNIENYTEAYMILRPIRSELHYKMVELKRRLNKLRGKK